MDIKVIAFYLPQYHETEENNRWWGNGFTEWSNMKAAQQLFQDQYQPRQPLNDYYYDLTDVETLKWQVSLAKDYGVYGFCMYHYWFNGKKLLQKPLELYLESKELDLPFCICWANENWSRSWNVRKDTDILIKQNYGDEREWKAHFDYLYPFLSDSRYIKRNGKPLLLLYRPEHIPQLRLRLEFWNNLAIQYGLPGIAYASQQIDYNVELDDAGDLFSYQIEYQPAFIRNKLMSCFEVRNEVKCVDYDNAWNAVLRQPPLNAKSIPGAFVDWDNTPRKGNNGVAFFNATPEKFYYYMKQQLLRTMNCYYTDMLFLFAWNEWSEGGYLEPDKRWHYGYLEKLRQLLKN